MVQKLGQTHVKTSEKPSFLCVFRRSYLFLIVFGNLLLVLCFHKSCGRMASLANHIKPAFEQGNAHLLDHRSGPAITNLDIPRQEFTNFSATAQEKILAIFSQLIQKVPAPDPAIPRLSSILRAERVRGEGKVITNMAVTYTASQERLRIDNLVRANDPHPPPKAFVGHFLTTVADPAHIPWDDNDDSEGDDNDCEFEEGIMRFDLPGKTLASQSPAPSIPQPPPSKSA